MGPPAFRAPGIRGPQWGVDPPSPQLRSLSRGRPKPAPPWGVTIWLQKSPLSIGGGEKGVLKGIGLFQKGLPRQVHPVRPRSHGGRRSHPLSPSSKTPQRLKAHPPWPVLPAAPCAPQGLPPRHCQPPRKSMGSSESRGGGAGGEAAGALSSCFHACCPPQGIRTPPHCLARPGPVVWCPGPFSTCVSLGTGANDARGEGRGSRGGAGLMARRCGQPPRAGPRRGDSGPSGHSCGPSGASHPGLTSLARACLSLWPQGFPSLSARWALALTLELSDAHSLQPHPEPSVCSAVNAEGPTQAWEQ